ncbi:hypothetical protein D9611_006287 [Ephemerocybe angulata]|uniref:Zn(2)-C6 fungal-type domain-containing protein n=1 Tax=Ephemerocybe angulata TaxID=980116 RepID=A0A8H5C8J3_9AGAR|nr:hypothetical protein D9611_006287 [Tulosesus angulatus]
MDQYERQIPHSKIPSSFLTSTLYSADPQRPKALPHDPPSHDDQGAHNQQPGQPAMRGAKRKRLAKACDACHKSKRRCDGTGRSLLLISDSPDGDLAPPHARAAPCSNCFFASKQCTYTDASGRPVPAPHRLEPVRGASSLAPETRGTGFSQPQASQPVHNLDPSRYPQPPRFSYPPSAGPSHVPSLATDGNDDERKNPRKRFRSERGNAIPPEDLIIDGPVTTITMDRPAPVDLDHGLTRELTNLFFAHCHPARAIIHKPTFAANLSHNRVPSYLLHAVCALAAPLSKQPRIRTNPARFAGKPFAQEALSLMFDGAGRLICEPNLAAAQALCLLQMHDILTKESNAIWESRYHDLALTIVDSLGVLNPEHPTLTPVPSPEFISASLEREAVRRIFWYIHLIDVKAAIYFKKPITFTPAELRLRLPVDETSFELGVHSTLPEYLHLPAVGTQYASEFGHLIRIITIYARVELILDDLCGPYKNQDSLGHTSKALQDTEHQMEDWARTLPEHLKFSEQSLDVQQSMFETSSNTGAWCWCCLHVYYAACALAINFARLRNQRDSVNEPQWALARIESILKMLGDRAKNSLLFGAALWALIKYCKRDDQQIRAWCADYEESFGTRMVELVQDWRPHPSPPQRHQYQLATQPPQSQAPTLQPPQRSQFRFSDNPGSSNGSSLTGRPPNLQQHGTDVSQNGLSLRSPTNTTNSYLRSGRYEEDSLTGQNSRTTTPPPPPRLSVHGHGEGVREGRFPPPAGMAMAGRALPPLAGDSGYGAPIKAEKDNNPSGRDRDLDSDGPAGQGQQASRAAAATGTGGGSSPTDSAPNSGPPSSRNSIAGEPVQTLPPLKGSGLLEWTHSHSGSGPRIVDMQQKGHGRTTGVVRASPRRSPPNLPPLYQSGDERQPSSMPVGLKWLAHESR